MAITKVVAGWRADMHRRTAFVRSGEDGGTIYTFDTPREVTGDELQRRLQAIQAQTRAKYCHSVAQVNQVLTVPPFEQPQAIASVGVGEIAGWGKVGEP